MRWSAKISVLAAIVLLSLLASACAEPTSDSVDFTELWQGRVTDVQVTGHGEVIRVLSDDNIGSRHQRFILQLKSSQTLLVAHNIDLAPRVESLQIGDAVEFYGEYEWNEKGGVIHWTHRDPNNRHPHGYLIHKGKKYW